MHRHKIVVVIAMIVFALLATSCAESGKKGNEPKKENFTVTIPAQNNTGRIRVYDRGELVFDYFGKVDIINDGRNGEYIEIQAEVEEKDHE